MKAFPVKGAYISCDNCSALKPDGEWQTGKLNYHDEDDLATHEKGYYYFVDECATATAWWCNECAAWQFEGEVTNYDQVWMCSRCDSYYAERDEADECCI